MTATLVAEAVQAAVTAEITTTAISGSNKRRASAGTSRSTR